MNVLILITIFLLITYLYVRRHTGALACLVVLYFNIISTALFGVSDSLFEKKSIVYFFLYILCIVSLTKYRRFKLSVYFTNPAVIAVCVFIVNMFVHDYVISTYMLFHESDMKAFQMNVMINSMFPFLALPLFIRNENEEHSFLNSIVFYAVLYYIVLFFTVGFNMEILSDRMLMEEDSIINPITLSRYAGIAVIFGFVYFFKSESIIHKSFFGVLTIVFFFVLLAAGQRGTLIGVMLAMSLLLFRQGVFKSVLRFLPFLIILGVVLTTFSFQVFERFEQFEDYDSFQRYDDYFNVFRIFESNYFLFGLGSCGYEFATGRSYPHNIVLEHIVNYGLVGFLCIMTILLCCVKYAFQILKRGENLNDLGIICCWIVLFFSACLSASIAGNRLFYIFSALIILKKMELQKNVHAKRLISKKKYGI